MRWPTDGVPDRPGAWLVTTGRRKAIDQIRRMRRFEDRLPVLAADIATSAVDSEREGERALDDQLALVVGCCHPALAPDAQVALTLRLVAGLSTPQIARAFLVSEETIDASTHPRQGEDPGRADPLRPTRPGHPRRACRRGVRSDLVDLHRGTRQCDGHGAHPRRSLRGGHLARRAPEQAGPDRPGSRRTPCAPPAHRRQATQPPRPRRPTDLAGRPGPVALGPADDRPRARRPGESPLVRRGGPFQFQAAIAALHATAPTFAATDWPGVLRLYDALLQRQPSALVALNRAIAVDHVHGPTAALDALDAIRQADDLIGDVDGYVYFHTARSDVLARLDRLDDADAALDRAIDCSTNESERSFLRLRRQDLVACRNRE